MERVKSLASSLSDQIVSWRRDIHQHPELELDCHRTAEVVSSHLTELGLQVKTGLAGTGVTGTLYGSGPGPVIALRVDMDALPLQEKTGLPFSSQNEGRMHACGHDGHTAMGLGAATVLSQLKDDFKGAVKFIFQPGEESPGGAKLMVDQGALEDPKVDALIGCHIFPGVEEGKIGIRYGPMTARNDEFMITLTGVGGHGAYPHKCADAVTAAGHLIVGIQTIVSRGNDPVNPLVVSITEVNGGKGFNVIPEKVILKGTIRSILNASAEMAHARLESLLKGIALSFGIQYELKITQREVSLVCDQALTAFAEKTIVDLIGRDSLTIIQNPSLGTDDIVHFSVVPTVYLRIGCYNALHGYVNNLHTPNFDFNEKILTDGTFVLSSLIYKYLSESSQLRSEQKGENSSRNS